MDQERPLTIPEFRPVVSTSGGRVLASSRDVAEYFGKRHDNVLRDIRTLIAQEPDLARLNFEAFKINDLTGESTSHYLMDRDGFTLLAMGFTGAKALRWKILYLEAFNKMEAELRGGHNVQAALNDPATLRRLLLQSTERVMELEAHATDRAPVAIGYDGHDRARGTLCITDAAKALGTRPKDLFSWLAAEGWIYRRRGSRQWIASQHKLRPGLLYHHVEKVTLPSGAQAMNTQVRVTARGMARLETIFVQALG